MELPACRYCAGADVQFAEWVAFLRTAVVAIVVMCRNPACTAARAVGKERYING